MLVKIQCDGSCLGNGKPDAQAGWGISITGSVEQKFWGKVKGPQTNNRAELWAVLKALEWLKEHKDYKAEIVSDSKLVIEGLKGIAKREANRDIWSQIELVCPEVVDRVTDVYHVPRESNAVADKLAKRGAQALLCYCS